LTATLTWSNSVSSGGDLVIGYEVTCHDPEFNDDTEMPWHRDNMIIMNLQITEDLLESIFECGGSDYGIFVVYVGIEKWGHDVHFDLTVEIT
jgi:hypothetical protein